MHGLSNTPIKAIPKTLKNAVNELKTTTLTYNHLTLLRYIVECSPTLWRIDALSAADKLDSLGIHIGGTFNHNDLIYVDKYWRDYIKWKTQHPGQEQELGMFKAEHSFTKWVSDIGINPDNYDIRLVKDLYDTLACAWNLPCNNLTLHEAKVVLYYLSRGLYRYEGAEYGTLQALTYISHCRELGVSPQTSNNFMITFADADDEVKNLRNQRMKESLEQHQNKHREVLQFEDDNFIIIVPTTPDEFVQEADAQRNCVARLYMPQVANGKTNVVFIRRKNNPDNSFITCEVLNGNIKQYKKAHNKRVVEPDALDFYQAYVEHLKKTWNNT